MAFVYGPFQSRRLGLSLGINLLGDKKKCTFNCVYCEIGRSKVDELVPISYRYDSQESFDKFLEEIMLPLKNIRELDSATFGYMGETTLASNLKTYRDLVIKLRDELSRDGNSPRISIFTNSTTIGDPQVLETLAGFDLVMAKLDAATPALFKAVNRPHPSVPDVPTIIEHLATLKEKMSEINPDGTLAIQTLVFNSSDSRFPSNATEGAVEDLIAAYKRIKPHFIQVYTVARQPAEKGIYAISASQKENLAGKLTRALDPVKIPFRIY